jgi:hypothetical protein
MIFIPRGFGRSCTPVLAVIVALAVLMLAQPGQAAVCANGVYRAGCVGPNGAVSASARRVWWTGNGFSCSQSEPRVAEVADRYGVTYHELFGPFAYWG